MPAQRSGAAPGWIQPSGDPKHEVLVHHDLVGIAAVGRAAQNGVGAIVGEGEVVLAVLLEPLAAIGAVAAGIDHAAHAGQVAGLEAGDFLPDLLHPSDDFVPGHHGESRAAPFVPRLVEIGVADAAEENLDVDVVRSGRSALEVERHERRPGARGGVAPGRQAGVEGGASGLCRVLNMCHEVLLDRFGVEVIRCERAEGVRGGSPPRRRFGALAAG
jgi:hypothetical protein